MFWFGDTKVYLFCVYFICCFSFALAEAVDVLDIDWASLRPDPIPKSSGTGSALKRFSPAALFSRIGVSRAYAGDALLHRLKTACQRQLDEEALNGKLPW